MSVSFALYLMNLKAGSVWNILNNQEGEKRKSFSKAFSLLTLFCCQQQMEDVAMVWANLFID